MSNLDAIRLFYIYIPISFLNIGCHSKSSSSDCFVLTGEGIIEFNDKNWLSSISVSKLDDKKLSILIEGIVGSGGASSIRQTIEYSSGWKIYAIPTSKEIIYKDFSTIRVFELFETHTIREYRN